MKLKRKNNSKNSSSSTILKTLSKRENEVTALIFEGYSTKNIAEMLGIKSNTVSTIKKNIFYKTGVRNNIDLFKSFCKENN